MKTQFTILVATLALSSVANTANAADAARKYIYNNKGQLVGVVRTDAKPLFGRTVKVKSPPASCASCETKKARK